MEMGKDRTIVCDAEKSPHGREFLWDLCLTSPPVYYIIVKRLFRAQSAMMWEIAQQ